MGADKAYLTAATMRRFMRLRPDLRPDEIAAEYLARLSGQTIRGSCVNHSATGCSLPREMRADTCNEYFCPSLREWQKRCAAGDPPPGAFVIQRREDNWRKELPEATNDVVGVSVVSGQGTRRIWTVP